MKIGADLKIGDTMYYVCPDNLVIQNKIVESIEGKILVSPYQHLDKYPTFKNVKFPLLQLKFVDWEKRPIIIYNESGGKNMFNGFTIYTEYELAVEELNKRITKAIECKRSELEELEKKLIKK